MLRTLVRRAVASRSRPPPKPDSVQVPKQVTEQARQAVRHVFKARREEFGLSTQDIFTTGLALMSGHPVDPMTDGPGRWRTRHFQSMRHLKVRILADMAEEGELAKVHLRIKERVLLPPPDDDSDDPPARHKDDVMDVVAVVDGVERTVKVVLPPRGQVSDHVWIWRAQDLLFERSERLADETECTGEGRETTSLRAAEEEGSTSNAEH